MSRYNRFRRANSSLPGYDNLGWEDFGHPASKAQPSVDDYGIDSEFGEGVRKGPYRSGPAPASYGWEPDHPAMRESLGQDFEETHDLYDANLKKAMERKASKCIEIAENRLGKYASQDEVEELALRYMDLPSRSINAKLTRIASEQYAGDEMQEATGYEGEDFGPGNVMADDIEGEMVSPAEILAEEIATLKAANRRLASEIRRVAEDSVQKATGYMGHDDGEDDFDDESDGPTARLADELNAHGLFDEYDDDDDGFISRDEWGGSSSVFDEMDEDMDDMLSRDEVAYGVGSSFADDMDQLSEMMAEAHEAGDEDAMAEILAEMEMLAGPMGNRGKTKGMKYKKHNEYGEAAPGYGYQDDDVRVKNRKNRDSDWNKKTKHFHNLNYYTNNKHLWKRKKKMASDFLADDILSDDEFASMVAELETMAGGPGSGGNNKGTRKVINEYGEAAPGFGYQDDDVRVKNRKNRDSDWNKKTKQFYDKNYYSANRGKIEGWPMPKNPRVAEMEAEDMLADEEQAMLAEMIAEMQASESEAGHHMAEDHEAGHHMAEDHESSFMAGAHEAGQDHMGLDMSAEEAEAGLDPKLARIFQAAEEVSEEAEASEAEADIQMAEEEATTKKSASFRPQTQARQASVKTLGNISREASSATDELSKLWESAPDVSKYFG